MRQMREKGKGEGKRGDVPLFLTASADKVLADTEPALAKASG
jgi:hypothetical protein